MKTEINTTCPYCGVGCGLIATLSGQALDLQGDPQHPANFGRLCSKGSALAETLSLDERLLYPRLGGERVSLDKALHAVAERFSATIERYGPDSVAFYVSGQLLTEDYYVANKLMKGYIGSANIDTNSRLCMSSAVAAYKRAFGADSVPCCYEDLDSADLIVLAGSNLAWCHPVLYQRIKKAKEQRPTLQVAVIDPRRTPTCEIADVHLALRPGSDAALFNGLLYYLICAEALDRAFISEATEGFEHLLEHLPGQASTHSVAAVARYCGLEEALVGEFFRLFAATRKTLTLYSQGINQSGSGVDKCNAIINCHLATGRIGKPGCGPFSITGQPNAMGGREVGGLANMLAAHMDFDPLHTDRVRRFWQSPTIAAKPGLKAVELFQAVAAGKIKALWIMATNPAVSMPDANAVRRALAACEFLVVSDCVQNTDTTQLADVLLPAAAWGEKDGTVTNSERCISRQRAFLSLPGEAQPDWWLICRVAQRMGFEHAFDYHSAADIFREHAALSGFENRGERDFNIAALQDLHDEEYRQLSPLQWPLSGARQGSQRLFENSRFYTPNGKARFLTVMPRPPVNAPDDAYPFILNTGRVRDQWHTMTRTGQAWRLTAHMPEPFVAAHPHDACRLGLAEGSIVQVQSRWGDMLARLRCCDDQAPGQLFAAMHWNDCYAANACVGRVVNPAVDPLSGQPESKQTPVKLQAFPARWHAFVLTRQALSLSGNGYRVKIRHRHCIRYELGDPALPADCRRWARDLLPQPGEWLEFSDAACGRYRAAMIRDRQLQMVVFAATHHDLPAREWLSELFAYETLPDSDRLSLLAGRPASGAVNNGKLVCACFGVNSGTLLEAIEKYALRTPAEVGQHLKAGTHCGSCLPEIDTLIALSEQRKAIES
ncbi:MAG: molybdopterin-dependent oxidoreductase [Gammaproteobacteria bacterium]